MSVGGAAASSRLCVKRLTDETKDHFLKSKLAGLAPPPFIPDLSPCVAQRSPAPRPTHSRSLSKVGPYLLLEPWKGVETYWAVNPSTQQQYTCKVLPLHSYQKQLAAYTQLTHHRSICTWSDVVIGQDSVYIFQPGHHGDMHAYVHSRKCLDEEEAGLLFTQMLNAVTHCHQHAVILRDLTLCKFVFTDAHRTRLALHSLDDCILLSGDRDDDLTDRHGSPAYVSPELLANGNTYSGRAADIWSLGVSLYTMLMGRYPFQDRKPAALFAKICREAFSLPAWLSPEAKCLIGCMLRKAPAERLTASELLMHPWLTNCCSSDTQHTQLHNDQTVPTWTKP
ncbi:LOW QUALITY PROTEIN: tribbles homolog 3 [Genypterus blacodes]|uniref:LOW QUALITY PROTEIN: tribbles homolog 3 n=1 Tax=Genypterus blacodes TaxID=154954 RepID=UPI003F75EDEE